MSGIPTELFTWASLGEPGTGKSALLKEVAQECARIGPVFVLKAPDRANANL
jgi:Cdc6-like AAA superfamily ATPase